MSKSTLMITSNFFYIRS